MVEFQNYTSRLIRKDEREHELLKDMNGMGDMQYIQEYKGVINARILILAFITLKHLN